MTAMKHLPKAILACLCMAMATCTALDGTSVTVRNPKYGSVTVGNDGKTMLR